MEVALLMEASEAVAMEDNNSKQHQVMAVVMDNSNKEDIDINYPHNHTMMT